MYKHNQEKISDGQIGLKNHQEAFILPFSQIFIFKKIPKTCILFVYLKITKFILQNAPQLHPIFPQQSHSPQSQHPSISNPPKILIINPKPLMLPTSPPNPTTIQPPYSHLLQNIITSQLIPPFVLPESPPYFVFNQQLGCYWRGASVDGKPFGNCLFYFQKRSPNGPVILLTSVEKGRYSKQSLVIFEDMSYYVGEIRQGEEGGGPVASGKGTMVQKGMIYQGEFEEGRPHGVGHIVSKGYRYYGYVEDCKPVGPCLQKTSSGLFVGYNNPQGKKGVLLTPQNSLSQVSEPK